MQSYQDPPCNGALIIMHMLKMSLSHDDNDYLKHSWIQMVIQNITKMYSSVPGPMISIWWKFYHNLFRTFWLILLIVKLNNRWLGRRLYIACTRWKTANQMFSNICHTYFNQILMSFFSHRQNLGILKWLVSYLGDSPSYGENNISVPADQAVSHLGNIKQKVVGRW